MHILSSKLRSEFLATPQLARFTMANGSSGMEPTLLIKSTTLTLKYLLSGASFRVVISMLDSGWIVYGIEIDDDPSSPALVWSLVESAEELDALRSLCKDTKCVVFLFNELALNVAWAEIGLDLSQTAISAAFESANLHPLNDNSGQKIAIDRFNQRRNADFLGDTNFVFEVSQKFDWVPVSNNYVTNSFSISEVSIVDKNEGDQQERLALWLIDNLHPGGAAKGPLVHEPGRPPRELSDLLLSYEKGSFIFESKSLSILARPKIPDRARLMRDVKGHVQKALRQLKGGVKNIKSGYRITNSHGADLTVERVAPPHAIVIVPDMTLLNSDSEFSGDFLKGVVKDLNCYVHFLDVAELLRVVQAAEMISARSQKVSPMMAFDFYLIERMSKALDAADPFINILLRFGDESSLERDFID